MGWDKSGGQGSEAGDLRTGLGIWGGALGEMLALGLMFMLMM